MIIIRKQFRQISYRSRILKEWSVCLIMANISRIINLPHITLQFPLFSPEIILGFSLRRNLTVKSGSNEIRPQTLALTHFRLFT